MWFLVRFHRGHCVCVSLSGSSPFLSLNIFIKKSPVWLYTVSHPCLSSLKWYLLAWRLFINFPFPSAVAQSAPFKNRIFVSCISVEGQICMCVEQKASISSISIHAAKAYSGHLLSRKFSLHPCLSQLIPYSVLSWPCKLSEKQRGCL